MRRIVLALALSIGFVSVLSAQTFSVSVLGLGQIFSLLPVDIDGKPGMEYFAKIGSPLHETYMVVYPGRCTAGPITVHISDNFLDFDGDGHKEIMRFNYQSQTVEYLPIPDCPN